MPPLPADSIHARACKLKCEKILTRPVLIYNHRRGMLVRGRAVSKPWIPSPLSRSTFDFVMKKSPQIEGTFVTLEIDAPGWRCHPGALDHGCKFNEPTRSRW